MKNIVILLLVSGLVMAAEAQQTPQQYSIPVNYLLYLPQGYNADTTTKYALMIFLHGSGESGTDLNKVKVHGPAKLIEQGRQFPFIVVSPQAAPGLGWNPEIFYPFLMDIKQKYRVDNERIYLTGLSMGGFGTWAIAKKYPSMFAAIVPICGGGDTTDIGKMRHIPVWCFHGGKDSAVSPEQSKNMVSALRKYSEDVRLTIYPEAGHDSWTQTYATDSLYDWMLRHKRYRMPRMTVTAAGLEQYTGKYIQETRNTLEIVVSDDTLRVKNHAGIALLPSSKDIFVVSQGDFEQAVRFERDKKGNIASLIVEADKMMLFKKVSAKTASPK